MDFRPPTSPAAALRGSPWRKGLAGMVRSAPTWNTPSRLSSSRSLMKSGSWCGSGPQIRHRVGQLRRIRPILAGEEALEKGVEAVWRMEMWSMAEALEHVNFSRPKIAVIERGDIFEINQRSGA